MSKKIVFPFEKEGKGIFRPIRRPIAQVGFFSKKFNRDIKIAMLVDTGADYTLLPRSKAFDLGIDLEKDCAPQITSGIGGTEIVFLLKKRLKISIGEMKRNVPLGFLERDSVPPLLGRFKCLESFDVLFSKFTTTFSEPNGQ